MCYLWVKKNCFRILAGLQMFVGLCVLLTPSGVLCQDNLNNREDNATDLSLGHDGAKSVIVARVNGVELSLQVLMEKMMSIAEKKYGRLEISALVAAKIKNDALNALIVEELSYQKSFAKVGAVSPDKVNEAIEGKRESLGGDEKFQEFLVRKGLTLQDYNRVVTRGLTVYTYIKQEIEDRIVVSDEEINLTAHGEKDEYVLQREQVQVSDIMLFVDTDSPEGLEKARQFRLRLINDFDSDPDKLPADGTFVVKKNIALDKQVNKPRYEAAKKAGEHGLSDPINVQGTYHIVKLTGYKPEIVKTLAEAKKDRKNELWKVKRRAMVDDWIAGLKDGADIEIVDAGM